MKTFQIVDPMIDYLNLFLNHRHATGEVVVFPDFPGQCFHLGLYHRLGFPIGDQYADQCDASRDCGSNDCIQFLTSLLHIHMHPLSIDNIGIIGAGICLGFGEKLGTR